MAKIELPVERDLGQLIGDPILFIRQNIKLMTSSFLYFMVPLLLVATALTTFGMKGAFKGLFDRTSLYSPSPTGLPNLLLLSAAYIVFILLYLFQQAYVAQCMVLYEKNKETTMSDVWKALLKDWKVIVLTYLSFIPLTALMFGAFALIISLSDAIGKPIAGFFLFIIYIGFMYVSIPLSNLVMVRLRERLGIIPSLGKSFRITAGKWWRTFGGLMMMLIIFYSLLLMAVLPFYFIIFFISMTRASGGGLPSINPAVAMALSGIYITAIVFWMFFLFQLFYVYIGVNYFTLSEAYDNYELRRQIINIGERPETQLRKQEGEY